MEESNGMANVALGAGIVIIVGQLAACCLGVVPFISMLNFIIVPVLFITDFIAIGTGFMGWRASSESGVGGPQSIAGLVIGVIHLLIQVIGMFLIFSMGGLAVLMSILQG